MQRDREKLSRDDLVDRRAVLEGDLLRHLAQEGAATKKSRSRRLKRKELAKVLTMLSVFQ